MVLTGEPVEVAEAKKELMVVGTRVVAAVRLSKMDGMRNTLKAKWMRFVGDLDVKEKKRGNQIELLDSGLGTRLTLVNLIRWESQ